MYEQHERQTNKRDREGTKKDREREPEEREEPTETRRTTPTWNQGCVMSYKAQTALDLNERSLNCPLYRGGEFELEDPSSCLG